MVPLALSACMRSFLRFAFVFVRCRLLACRCHFTNMACLSTCHTRRPRRRVSGLLLLAFVLLASLSLSPVEAIDAKWSPNDEEGAGPLPLSQNQRDQLFQLEEAIVTSPDPQGTLMKIAESNGMGPRELVDLLERNRVDGEAAGTAPPRPGGGGGGGGGGIAAVKNTLPRRVLGVFFSVFSTLGKVAKAYPQAFSVVFTALLLAMYCSIQAPRTGIVMSTGPNPLLLSSGHTTFFVPPAAYLARYMESNRFINAESSVTRLPPGGKAGSLSKVLEDELENRAMLDGSAFVKPSGRKSAFSLAATAQKTLSVREILPDEWEAKLSAESTAATGEEGIESANGGEEQNPVDERVIYIQNVADTVLEAATTVLSAKRFTEFSGTGDGTPEPVRFQPSPMDGRKSGGTLVVKSLGDFGRFGLQPLRVVHQEESEDAASVVFSTLRGGHFDGEIRFAVQMKDGEDDDDIPSIAITASLVCARKGRKLGKKYAERIVATTAESIAASIATQAKQSMARRKMSSQYRGRVSGSATERRQIRFENERKMEEMAEDRRRRWQRSNPDAGHYRPSGDRMRSPNNC